MTSRSRKYELTYVGARDTLISTTFDATKVSYGDTYLQFLSYVTATKDFMDFSIPHNRVVWFKEVEASEQPEA